MFSACALPPTAAEAYCPHCGCVKVYTLAETPIRWKCAACRRKFSVTSGTIFHSRKLAIRDYLGVIALFCNGVKGTSSLQMSRDMNINPKSAFVLLHKLREAMGATVHAGDELAGTVEVDGMLRRRGHARTGEPGKADRTDLRRARGTDRQAVGCRRRSRARWPGEALGCRLAQVDGVPLIRQHVASGTEVHADEAAGWNVLHASYPDAAGQSFGRIQERRRRVHQLGGKLLLPAAPRGNGHPPSDQRPPASSLRERMRLAREQPAPVERRALEPDHRRRAGALPRASGGPATGTGARHEQKRRDGDVKRPGR